LLSFRSLVSVGLGLWLMCVMSNFCRFIGFQTKLPLWFQELFLRFKNSTFFINSSANYESSASFKSSCSNNSCFLQQRHQLSPPSIILPLHPTLSSRTPMLWSHILAGVGGQPKNQPRRFLKLTFCRFFLLRSGKVLITSKGNSAFFCLKQDKSF
jgi:hypothetical protein